ncbi:copper resistance protein A [Microbulbifer sp. NBRC 101763]|uniref:copper resistance system multicopper oxidase n=1 Tax=Microbulbifer sp. NBRC 101763 TaxID=1113820 RepID=UPI003098D5C4
MTNPPWCGAISRRTFVTGLTAGAALLGLSSLPLAARTRVPPPTILSGEHFSLKVGQRPVNFTGQRRNAISVNGSVPGPVLHWREGQTVTLNVFNQLPKDTSIHWHGIRVPSNMNGVPGLNFPGIRPGENFRYRFKVKQSGTYWYHSHSSFQRQQGLYGAIVIDPIDEDPVAYDRDYVVLLSDWSDDSPQRIYSNLKKDGHYYNRHRRRTTTDLWRDVRAKGIEQTWRERHPWNFAGISDRDVSDITSDTYSYLINGQTPEDNWTALFAPGEKVRLRFINASAMTIFDLRIPGLDMTVVSADGQNIQPLRVDEFRLGTGETYDVVVRPKEDRAYTLFAQAIDRGGFARGTLTPNQKFTAEVPSMDPIPILDERDLGFTPASGAKAAGRQPSAEERSGKLAPAGQGSNSSIIHQPTEKGHGVALRALTPKNGVYDPGVGLRKHQQRYNRRVLCYADLRSLTPSLGQREPQRELQLHLTGNPARYLWSVDGVKYRNATPILLTYGERLRITLVNDTLLTQPMHLHGLWSELETGDGEYLPRKHTVIVQPGAKISFLVNADTRGRWALHCQMLYRAHGIFREVRVV